MANTKTKGRWIRFTQAAIKRGMPYVNAPNSCPLFQGFTAAGYENVEVWLSYIMIGEVRYDFAGKAEEFYLRRIMGYYVPRPTRNLMRLQPFELFVEPGQDISLVRPLKPKAKVIAR